MKIAILDDYSNAALDMADWSCLNADITVFSDTITGTDSLVKRLATFKLFYEQTVEAIAAWQAGKPIRTLT